MNVSFLLIHCRKLRAISVYVIFMFILVLVSCKAIVNNTDNEHYFLLEVIRQTTFTALSDTCTGFDIDFGGYLFNEDKGELEAYHSYYHFNNNDPFQLVCAIDRSLAGAFFNGKTGGCWPIYSVPDTVRIISYPLPGPEDDLSIIEIRDNGGIKLAFSSTDIHLQPKEYWIYTENRNVVTEYGYFHVADSIRFVNHGLLEKGKIVVY